MTAALDGTESNQPRRRNLVAAGVIGNILEWYDFSVYESARCSQSTGATARFSVPAAIPARPVTTRRASLLAHRTEVQGQSAYADLAAALSDGHRDHALSRCRRVLSAR